MYQIYKVEGSDTLDSIARKFNISVDKLREINGLGELYSGGYILVPAGNMTNQNNSNDMNYGTDYITYLVKQGDNMYAIAREYGVPFETLLRVNGLNKSDYIYPGQQIMIPRVGSGIYVTTETDTIESIYNKYKDNWDMFLAQNKTIYIVPDQMITYK